MVFQADALAASHREVLQAVDARSEHISDESDAGDGGVTEVEAGQAGSVREEDMVQQALEAVGLGQAVTVGVERLGRRRRRRQAERERLPGERVVAKELAQVARRMVEVEDAAGGQLGEQRLEDGWIRRHNHLERAERQFFVGRGSVIGSVVRLGGRGFGPRAVLVLLVGSEYAPAQRGLAGHGEGGSVCMCELERERVPSSVSWLGVRRRGGCVEG